MPEWTAAQAARRGRLAVHVTIDNARRAQMPAQHVRHTTTVNNFFQPSNVLIAVPERSKG